MFVSSLKIPEKLFLLYKTHGLSGLWNLARGRAFPVRARCFPLCQKLLLNKSGLEIGGPSLMFGRRGLLPVYSLVSNVDNSNFSSQTVWQGALKEGLNYQYDSEKPPGRQFLSDATDLSGIPSFQYDFLLSSHVIEHIANPIKALHEWTRVLKQNGVAVIALPHKDGTFDHSRAVTPLEHLIADFTGNVEENDLTHLAEILEYHDLGKDPEAGTLEKFRQRSQSNFENRCLHHHVFDALAGARLIDYVGLQILAIETGRPHHIIIVAQKSASPDNRLFLDGTAEFARKSPFASDWVRA